MRMEEDGTLDLVGSVHDSVSTGESSRILKYDLFGAANLLIN